MNNHFVTEPSQIIELPVRKISCHQWLIDPPIQIAVQLAPIESDFLNSADLDFEPINLWASEMEEVLSLAH